MPERVVAGPWLCISGDLFRDNPFGHRIPYRYSCNLASAVIRWPVELPKDACNHPANSPTRTCGALLMRKNKTDWGSAIFHSQETWEDKVRKELTPTTKFTTFGAAQATLVAPCERSLRLSPDCTDPLAHHAILYDEVLLRKNEFDILHFHTDYAHFPISKNLDLPVVTTLQGQCVSASASATFLFQATSDHRD